MLSLSPKALFMQIPELRNLHEEKDIFNHLNSIAKKGKEVILWQTIGNDRMQIKAKLVNLNLFNNTFEAQAIDSQLFFAPHLPIYMFFPGRCLILKTQIKSFFVRRITLEIPENLKLKEYRQFPRLMMNPTSEPFWLGFAALHGDRLGLSNVRCPILDASSNGLAFKSSFYDSGRFNEGDLLYLHAPHLKGNAPFSSAKIHYKKKYFDMFENTEHMRIGVIFEAPFKLRFFAKKNLPQKSI